MGSGAGPKEALTVVATHFLFKNLEASMTKVNGKRLPFTNSRWSVHRFQICSDKRKLRGRIWGALHFGFLAKIAAPRSCGLSLEARNLHPRRANWILFLNKGQLVWNLGEVDNKSGQYCFLIEILVCWSEQQHRERLCLSSRAHSSGGRMRHVNM